MHLGSNITKRFLASLENPYIIEIQLEAIHARVYDR